jgi:hypothetical protein
MLNVRINIQFTLGPKVQARYFQLSNYRNAVHIPPPAFSGKYWRNRLKFSAFSSYSAISDPMISFRSLSLHYSTFSSPIFCRNKGSRRQLSRYRNLPTDRQSAELCFISLQRQETIFCTKATVPAVGWNWPPFKGYRETSRVVM